MVCQLNKRLIAAATAAFAASSIWTAAAFAQAPMENGMAMTLLPVIHENGRQFIITPRGYKVEVEGNGIASNAQQVAVYQDPERNYWFINKHGQPQQVPAQVLQSVYAQLQAQMNVQGGAPGVGAPYGQPYPAGYPQQPPVQQTTIVNQPPADSSSSSGSAAGTALMAGVGGFAGAAVGSALTNDYYKTPYYGVPYGTPIYRGGAHNNGNSYYYYNNNGTKNYVNANEQNANIFKQYDQQGNWKDRNNWANNPQAQGQFQNAAQNRSNAQSDAGRGGLFNRGERQQSGGGLRSGGFGGRRGRFGR